MFTNSSATKWDSTVHSESSFERYAEGVGGALVV